MGCLNEFKRAYKTLADTTLHLMKKTPDGKQDWTPPVGDFLTMGQLLYHLGETQRFLRLILEGTFREMDKNFMEYMTNHPSADRDEGIKYFKQEHDKVMKMLNEMTEDDFVNKKHYFWTVADEPTPFIAFNVIEHNASHKYQLFMYLKMLGVPNMDSLALAGEDGLPKEEVIKMYAKAHEEYEKAHGIKA